MQSREAALFVFGCMPGLVSLAACSPGAQKSVIESALANDGERATSFEATARALDEHPDYVDQFYAVARRHPRMMGRILADTTRDLRDPALAIPTATLLAETPDALEETLVATLDAAATKPRAPSAIDRALAPKSERVGAILAEDHDAVVRCMNAVVAAVRTNAIARRAFLDACVIRPLGSPRS
jgi:hypothetical protein